MATQQVFVKFKIEFPKINLQFPKVQVVRAEFKTGYGRILSALRQIAIKIPGILHAISVTLIAIRGVQETLLDHIPNEDLDNHPFTEIEAKCAAESEARIDAFERGELQAVDGPTALRELRSLLEKMNAQSGRTVSGLLNQPALPEPNDSTDSD